MHANWITWAASTVVYDAGDTISFVFALSSLLPSIIVIFIAGLASSSTSHQRDAALLLLVGLCQNTALNTFLKAFIKGPRPISSMYIMVPMSSSSNYGMPSYHSQFMFFFITWLLRKASANHIPVSWGMWLFFLVSATVVACGRVYNSYHSTDQVIVGAAVGVINAYASTTPTLERVLRWLMFRLSPVRNFFTSWVTYVRL
ncbi:phosphatidic acid phosphatase, putative [Trypanosoma brucei gambiense DAL972]|uniref:Phosphatidic acid phosphatase, putative n=1 Tax=Trypanosoma brucei gambiense (strain MHOM/CI/86/DAL972) TaxID=679716 RepID=C9ZQJ4_TRYB9|nr:phosphatidic acid phosphatase, putative [Trypanosoma brucei gambiense DAL972]CBH11674.1 phosphatidic acid phosphatase, putative [Trypanosoma brucei gambiense DAL972]|eukprot:XP_011773959.1 phosphatidic acid phosphatase, putative [Trypanosoma brucei gambiense DAL972]